jgi:hypothetical protein
MRLLRLGDNGEFSLVEFVGKNIPPYAVLSHTWGADHEEVTFKDIVKGIGKRKAGYITPEQNMSWRYDPMDVV